MGKGLTLRGGHWAQDAALRTRLLPTLGPAVARAGYVVQGDIQRTSPVKTGALRRSWTVAPPAWQGSVLRADVGTNLPYAHYQDTATRNKGYIGRGVARATPGAVNALRAGLQAALRPAWVPE